MMDFSDILSERLKAKILDLLETAPCDNCGQIEDTWTSITTLSVFCPTCKSFVQRICDNRNKRAVDIQKLIMEDTFE